VKIVLTKEHTHNGVLYLPGDQLEVYRSQADWLLQLGIAQQMPEDEYPPNRPPDEVEQEEVIPTKKSTRKARRQK